MGKWHMCLDPQNWLKHFVSIFILQVHLNTVPLSETVTSSGLSILICRGYPIHFRSVIILVEIVRPNNPSHLCH